MQTHFKDHSIISAIEMKLETFWEKIKTHFKKYGCVVQVECYISGMSPRAMVTFETFTSKREVDYFLDCTFPDKEDVAYISPEGRCMQYSMFKFDKTSPQVSVEIPTCILIECMDAIVYEDYYIKDYILKDDNIYFVVGKRHDDRASLHLLSDETYKLFQAACGYIIKDTKVFKVDTRLIAAYSEEEASEIYKKLMEAEGKEMSCEDECYLLLESKVYTSIDLRKYHIT